MPKKKAMPGCGRLFSWYRNLPITMKAAIVGGVFVLLAAIPTVLELLRPNTIIVVVPESTEMSTSPVVKALTDTPRPKPTETLHSLLTPTTIQAPVTPTASLTPKATPTPSFTPAPTDTPTATSTNTLTPTPTNTPPPTQSPTPTPEPRLAILHLIEAERQAVLEKRLDLIKAIFTADAIKTDAATGEPRNAIQDYAEDFQTEDHLEITHANLQFDIVDDTATVTNDSCGSLIDRKRDPGQREIDYSCVQCDRWTFRKDSKGQWWITSFTYNLAPVAPSQKYTFEYGNNGCWCVRYVEGEVQGQMPTHTSERAHEGKNSLRFTFDLGNLRTGRAQTIHYNMPFAGQASAYVYAPPDAPADLEAGFLAMELDHDPWNEHYAEEMYQLVPGQWNEIKWTVDRSGWRWPLHLFGIGVRRAGGGPYQGYVLIDDVTIKSK